MVMAHAENTVNALVTLAGTEQLTAPPNLALRARPYFLKLHTTLRDSWLNALMRVCAIRSLVSVFVALATQGMPANV
jgi:hypothetical protein